MTLHELARALSRPANEIAPTTGLAAVALVFDEDFDLLLIRRATSDRDPWSGHVSLPGGRVEPTDASALAGAVREVEEEVGLALDEASALGRLDDLVALGGRPGLVVRPYVFHVPKERPELTPNYEVATTMWWPLSALLANEGRGPMAWERGGHRMTLPRVDRGGERLWGLTLMIVDDLLDRLDGGGRGLARRSEEG